MATAEVAYYVEDLVGAPSVLDDGDEGEHRRAHRGAFFAAAEIVERGLDLAEGDVVGRPGRERLDYGLRHSRPSRPVKSSASVGPHVPASYLARGASPYSQARWMG